MDSKVSGQCSNAIQNINLASKESMVVLVSSAVFKPWKAVPINEVCVAVIMKQS